MAAILFDLDDTLVMDNNATTDAFLAACTLAQMRHGIDPVALTVAVRRRARQLWQTSSTIEYCRAIGISSTEGLRANFVGNDPHLVILQEWAPTYRQMAWSAALADCGICDTVIAEELAMAFIKERGERHAVFPDVVPVLTTLMKTSRLALVTNGSPDLQRAKLTGSGLTPYFDVVIVSGEIGVGKPDARPFALALDRLGVVDRARTIMVGDSHERDLVGARNAGIRGMWIDRNGTGVAENSTAPEERITDLTQLLPLL